MRGKNVIFATFLIVAIAFGIMGCFSQGHNLNSDVISSGENFAVYDITKDNQPEYRYEIYNQKGKTVESITVWKAQPVIRYLDNSTILSIRTGVGTGTSQHRYYDFRRDIFSEVFESVKLEKNGTIAFMIWDDGGIKLVIRDIFDESIFYREFEFDFSPVANSADALLQIDFLDENAVKILYLSGVDYEEAVAVLQLN
jgi:hypothetical protein